MLKAKRHDVTISRLLSFWILLCVAANFRHGLHSPSDIPETRFARQTNLAHSETCGKLRNALCRLGANKRHGSPQSPSSFNSRLNLRLLFSF